MVEKTGDVLKALLGTARKEYLNPEFGSLCSREPSSGPRLGLLCRIRVATQRLTRVHRNKGCNFSSVEGRKYPVGGS